MRLITGNSDSSLMISTPWDTIPDTSSSFTILRTTPIDITVSDVPDYNPTQRSGGLVGYGFNIGFDPRTLAIVGVNPVGSPIPLVESSGVPERFAVIDADASNGPSADALPSMKGDLRLDIMDLSTSFESGDGLLARILVVRLSSDPSEITVNNPLLFDAVGNEYWANDAESRNSIKEDSC